MVNTISNESFGISRKYFLLQRMLKDYTSGMTERNGNPLTVGRLRDILSRHIPAENADNFTFNLSFLSELKTDLKNQGLFNEKYEDEFSGDNVTARGKIKEHLAKYDKEFNKVITNNRGERVLHYVNALDMRPEVAKYAMRVLRYTGSSEMVLDGSIPLEDIVENEMEPKMLVTPASISGHAEEFRNYTKNTGVLMSPYLITPQEEAKIKGEPNGKIYADRIAKLSELNIKNNIARSFGGLILTTEDRDGNTVPLSGYEIIDRNLGQFLSDNDLRTLAKSMPDKEKSYSPYAIKQAKAVLQKLYDSGMDFDLVPKVDAETNRLSVHANITSSNANRLDVRVLEDDGEEDFIGRIYDSHGAYYVSPRNILGKSMSTIFTDADIATAPLDYVTGTTKGELDLYGKDSMKANGTAYTSTVNVFHKANQDAFIGISYRSYEKEQELQTVHPDTPEIAEAQLKRLISLGRNQFIHKAIGPDLTNVDNVLSDYQAQLNEFMKENNMSKDMLDVLNDLPFGASLVVRPGFLAEHDISEEEAVKYQQLVARVNELADDGIGSFSDGFHPANVVNMVSEISNNHAQEQLVASLIKSDYDLDKLKQDETTKRFMESMIQYRGKSKNVKTLKDTDDSKNPQESMETNPFIRDLMEYVSDTLQNAGIVGTSYNITSGRTEPNANAKPDVSIDSQGILHWEGHRPFYDKPQAKKGLHYEPVTGEIGQIFAPDEHGIAHIELNGNESYDYVPGISGYYQYDGMDEEDDNRMKRLRGMGYEQLMRHEIFNALNVQLQRPYRGVSDTTFATDLTSLNKIYHGESYGTRLEKGWYDNPDTDKSVGKDIKDAIIKNLRNRVHFPNKLRDNATTFSQSSDDFADTKVNGVSQLVDGKNLRVLDADYTGTFDMTMTGTNKTQGMVLYLDDGAKLNTDGTITPVSDEDILATKGKAGMAPVRALDLFKYQKYNAWDRNQMASNQILTANGVDQARTALMTMGGWTYDDSAVISKDFAERNMVKGEDGVFRPLTKGDKISDFGGNKATIGLVVDRDMNPDDAEKEGIAKEVAIFKENPELDTVMSPYSVITRDNTGVVKELMEHDPKPIMFTDPETGKTERIGDSGNLNLIITDMLADSKTHAYSEEDIAEGKGRKLSSQYVWALNQHGADKIVQTAFNKNGRQWMAYREYLLVTGYDISPEGNLVKSAAGKHFDKDAQAFVDNDPVHELEDRKEYHPTPDLDSTEFIRQLGSAGGDMVLPFEVELASGVKTNKFPIMSASLRYNTEFMDGSTKVNDYTKSYADLYDSVLSYNRFEHMKNEGTYKGKRPIEEVIKQRKDIVQRKVDALSNEIINDKLGGKNGEYSKHSFMRDHLMGIRMEHSATAIATADPRLSVNEVAISPEVAKSLNVEDGDYALVNRDPCLHAGSIRAMPVKIDESIQGIALSPTADKSFDGDFDGDTYGLITMPEFKTDPEIKKELEKMEIKSNLLDPGAPEPTSYLNISMDVVSGSIKSGDTEYTGPDMPNLPSTQLANKLATIAVNNEPDVALAETDRIIKRSINSKNYGAAKIDLIARDGLSADEAMERSIRDMTDTGAKGSNKKVDEYMSYFSGNGKSFSEKLKADNEIQLASGYKSDLTGVAGSYSQKLIALTRDIDPAVALEVTYKASQGTLQIKHDPDQAKVVHEVLNNDLKRLFNGQHMDSRDGSPLTKNQFVREFNDVYTNKLGVDVSTNQLTQLADTLSAGTDTVKAVSDLMETHASPIDRIAYGGGFKAIKQMANESTNLYSGKHSSLMVPESLKNPDNEKDVLLRHDTQEEVDKNILNDELNKMMDPAVDHILNENVIVRNNFAPEAEDEPVEKPAEAERPKSVKEKASMYDELDINL